MTFQGNWFEKDSVNLNRNVDVQERVLVKTFFTTSWSFLSGDPRGGCVSGSRPYFCSRVELGGAGAHGVWVGGALVGSSLP